MISFQAQHISFKLKQQRHVKNWLLKIAEKEKKEIAELNYVFMDDAHLIEHNIQYLNHATYTDIITFDYCVANQISGDILISIERVRENAIKFGVEFESELKRVMAHGMLHLCGYKDKKAADVAIMRRKENSALKLWLNLSA